MAKKKVSKKAQREMEKLAKKYPILIVIAFLLIVVLVGCVLLHKKGIIHIAFLDSILPQESEVDSKGGAFTPEDIAQIQGSDLSIHFLMLGNEYTGDSVLIKSGNTEVLIDAGSRKNSAKTITDYVRDFCTDGVLEYVIATHADRDHISAFISSSDMKGVFESFECETIIDFPRTNKDDGEEAELFQEYIQAREAEVAAGAVHYTALECWQGANGAQRSYALSDTVSMNFLYQKFYEEDTGDENDYSVCMLLTEETESGNVNYLFTGDLEKEGEESLVENNTLPKCKLFKAGHHGSKTSSSDTLLSVIRPEIVCVCCCCGSDEYKAKPENTFPTQAFVDRVANYTENVYVTTLANDSKDGFEAMNGNIVVMSNDGEISVRCSANATVFKDTEWFKNNREIPSAWAD